MKNFKQLIFVGICTLALCCQSVSPLFAVAATTPETDNTSESEEVEPTQSPIGNNNTYSTQKEIGTDVNISLLDNWTTPVATYGQTVNIVLPLVNLGNDNLTNIIISPEISTSTDDFPFEIEKTSYNTYINDLPGASSGLGIMDRRREITYTLKTRDDVVTGYQKLSFDVTYTLSSGETGTTTVDTFIETVGKSGASSSSDGKVSTPRLIVSGFTTTPETVKAGDTFTLTLHITNTSKATAVSNLTFDLQAPVTGKDESSEGAAFLPVSGSSIIFVDSIAANATKDISIELESRADLSQKPYVLTVNMEYEDSDLNAYTSDASVSIPIKQEAKFDIGSIDVMPSSITVGSESNIMFNINNTGKTTLYNVNISFESDSVTGGETFLGNIEIGATGNVDAMITGQAVTTDEGKVKAIVSYEDESGNVSTQEKEFELFVTEESFDDFDFSDDFMSEEFVDGTSTSSSHIALIIGIVVVVLALIGVGVFIFIKKKKNKNADDFFDLDEGESDDNELS